MVASGPFTVAGDLVYHPLDELVSCIAKHRPSLVVLLGPFVDVDAGPIQDGSLDETFNAVFQREVRSKSAATSSEGTVRDACPHMFHFVPFVHLRFRSTTAFLIAPFIMKKTLQVFAPQPTKRIEAALARPRATLMWPPRKSRCPTRVDI